MSLIAMKAAALGVWFAVLFTLERIAPASPAPPDGRRLARNFGLWAVTALSTPALVLALASLAQAHAPWTRPAALQGVAGLALSLVALDLWTYFMHRAYHEVPVMWRLHAPHHLDERLDTSSAVRFHAGEVGLSAVFRLVPIAGLAIPLAHVALFETLLLAGAIFHHSNVRLPAPLERALSSVIVTPSIHWVHHHARRADTDANYAAVLSVWDRVFGTKSPTPRTPDMAIGVEGEAERGFWGLLVQPFTGRPAPAAVTPEGAGR
ncbi:MAG: sterol desaturase family protein [Pseudomonadota bacterium]